MKKIAIILCLVLSFSLIACGCDDKKAEDSKKKEAEVISIKTDQTAMCNSMQYDSIYTINDGWYYGICEDEDTGTFGFAMYRIDSGSESAEDVTWIKKDHIPSNFIVKDEYIYFKMRKDGGDTQSLWRCRIGGTGLKKLQSSYISAFQIYKNKIYFSKGPKADKMNTFYRCDLNGKNRKVIFKKGVYFPYFTGDYLFYQDDKDKERLLCFDF